MSLKEQIKLLHRAWRYRLAEKHEVTYLLNTIKKGDTVLDIGAHKGAYTYWMKNAVGDTGRVIAFEAQEKGSGLLNKIFASKNVIVEHLAISDTKGLMDLFIQPQSMDISFEASLSTRYRNAIVEKVKTDTIDNYCSTHHITPSFIKIDVEGHELNVVQGARKILLQHRPTLLAELEIRHMGAARFKAIFEHMKDLGYRSYFFLKGKKTSTDRFKEDQWQSPDKLGTAAYINNFIFESGKAGW